MAEAVNKRISASCNQDGLVVRLEEVFQVLVETYRGRDWPKVADFVNAMKEARPSGSESNSDFDQTMLEWARKLWFEGSENCSKRTVIPPANTWQIAKVLISEGADPWEIRYSNFQTETDFYSDLEDSGQVWKGHDAVLDRLRAEMSGNAA